MNKSILIICTSLNLGGSERQAVWLANQLSEKGFDVIYVSLKEPGILSNKISPNVTVKNFEIGRQRNRMFKIIKFCNGVLNLRKIVKEMNEIVIISFLFHSNLVGKLVKILTSQKIKHVIAFRSDRLSKRDSNINRFRTTIFKRFIVDSRSLVVFNSNSGFNNMKLKKVKQKIIYNAPINSPINLPMSNNIAYVGRLDKLKNLQNLILAIALLPIESALKLHIYGSGPEREALKDLVFQEKLESKVIFKGIDESISNKLQSYKAVVLTSTHEAFSNILIETMNSSRIPISTLAGDAEELLSNNRGILIDGYSPDKIYEAIIKLENLSNEDLKKIQQNAKTFVNNNLTENLIIDQWIETVRHF